MSAAFVTAGTVLIHVGFISLNAYRYGRDANTVSLISALVWTAITVITVYACIRIWDRT